MNGLYLPSIAPAAALAMMLAAAPAALAVPASSPGPASRSTPLQDQDGEVGAPLKTSWYDLRPLAVLATEGLLGVDVRLQVGAARIDNLEPDHLDVPISLDEELSVDDCVSAIERAVIADPAAELDDIQVFKGRLQVTGNDAAQAIAKRTVNSLQALASESVKVDVLRIGTERLPEGSGAILSPAETTLLFERAGGVAQLSQDVALGRRSVLGQEKLTSFMADYDVEVAQGAMVPDPTISVIHSGLSVGMRVDRAADDQRLVVRTWGRDGDLILPMQNLAMPGFADALIELPAVRSGLFVASGLVESGGAIVLSHGGGKTGTVVLRITDKPRSATYPAETLMMGEHMLGDMRVNPTVLPRTSPSQGWFTYKSNLQEQTAPWANNGVGAQSFVDEVIGLPLQAEALVPVGSRALYVGADVDRTQLRERFLEYAAMAPRHTFAVSAAYATVSADEAAALRVSGDYGTFAQGAENLLTGAALEGDTLLLVGGTESAYLQDYDVQIAQGAAIADPIIATTFEGMAFWCSPVAAEGDGMLAWFDITYHAPGGEQRSIPIANYHANVGDASADHALATGRFKLDLEVQLPETRRSATRALIALDDEEWRLLTAQPIQGTADVLVLVARAAATK